MKTTLNKIKAAGACQDRYAHLLNALGKTKPDDEPLTIARIIETNGIQDAVWALRTVEGYDREIRLFAADCDELVLPIFEAEYPDDDRPRRAIQAARDYANGLIDKNAAADAARAARAAYAAADAAAFAAADAARAAYAADAAADAAAFAAAFAAFAKTWEKVETILKKYL